MNRLLLLAPLLFLACAPAPQPPLAPLTGPASAAPMPSAAADDYAAAQRARGATAATGPAAMPGLVSPEPISADIALPDMPAQRAPAFSR
jgi:hypothetical protein